jgi:hypothetical protein
MKSKESILLARLDVCDLIVEDLEKRIKFYKNLNFSDQEAMIKVFLTKALKIRDKERMNWNKFITNERTPKNLIS